MARKMTEWPSKRGPITKIMPSDGCIGDTVPLAVGKWYDFHEFGWYMGNVGSGGIFRDMTIHDFDMVRFLLGDEVEMVQATASVLVNENVAAYDDFDTVSVILTTSSGQQCVISNSRRATYGYDQRIEVLGSIGMISAENHRPVSIEIANADGFTRPPLHDFFMTRYTDAYAAEIAAFIAATNDKTAPTPPGDDGRIALALSEAALKSVTEGRAVHMSEFD